MEIIFLIKARVINTTLILTGNEVISACLFTPGTVSDHKRFSVPETPLSEIEPSGALTCTGDRITPVNVFHYTPRSLIHEKRRHFYRFITELFEGAVTCQKLSIGLVPSWSLYMDNTPEIVRT